MAELYGSFLVEGTENYGKYYEKFKARVDSLATLADLTRGTLCHEFKELDGFLHTSYSNIVTANVRYFNDVIRLKAMHKIETVNHSKMFAYSGKWLSINPGIVCTLNRAQYRSASPGARKIAFNANLMFIHNVGSYFFKNVSYISDPEISLRVQQDIGYLIKTGLYEEHTMASLLSMLTINERL